MNRLFAWLEKEATGWAVLRIFFAVFILHFVYYLTAVPAMEALFHFEIPPTVTEEEIAATGEGLFFVIAVFSVPPVEELLFRLFPLAFAVALVNRSKFPPKLKMPILAASALLSSVLFGWLHGSWLHVLSVGMTGMVMCMLFLKCGGLHFLTGEREAPLRLLKAYYTVVAFHALWNTLALVSR